MTRTDPSALDVALVAEVGKLGVTISPTQLERWRTQLWLPRAADWVDPGTGEIRAEIVDRAAYLAGVAKPGRSISWFGWIFWAIDETPETAARLRKAVADALVRPFRRSGVDLGQVPGDGSEAAFEARREMAAALMKGQRCPKRDFDGTLRAGASEAGFELPPSRSVSNMFHKALMAPGARLMVGGADDVGFEELMDAWEAASPDKAEMIKHMPDAHLDAALAGVDLFASSPLAGGLRGLVRAVQDADDQTLCAAVRAGTKGSVALGILLDRAPNQPEILRPLMADEMWDHWVRAGFAPVLGVGGEAAIAMGVVWYLLLPGWAEGMARYQVLMETLLTQSAA